MGLTSFLACIFAGRFQEQLLETLLAAKASASAQDARGVGALHFAALRADVPLLEWLLEHKAKVDMQTEHCTTPLMLVAKRGHVDGASLLLGFRANITLADEAGCTALMLALSNGHSDVALKILEHLGSNAGTAVELRDCAGRSALFHAVLGGDVSSLQAVIDRGARVNTLDEEGQSPLYQACLMGAPAMVRCLLDADADPNLAGRASAVRPAVQDEDKEDEDEKGASAARACLEEARTCLQVCATLAHNELMIGLMEKGAELNAAPGALGWTALHLASAVGNREGADMLLSRGACLFQRDAEGNCAQALAERAGHEQVLERLREAAALSPDGGAAGKEAPQRRATLGGSLPPIHAGLPTEEPEEDEAPPLEAFQQEWTKRDAADSQLDRFCGPMVHDALKHEQWRLRWEAVTYLAAHMSETTGTPGELVAAVATIVEMAAKDKVPKVFSASLTVFEELLADPRLDALGAEEFTAVLRGQQPPQGAEGAGSIAACPDVIAVLLDQAEYNGGSTAASSPQQAAVDALCSCVLHGRVALDDAALPLLSRIDERLSSLAAAGKGKDRKEAAQSAKCLAANVRLLARWLSTFGLQQTGLFRRALVLPLLLRGAASEHSKVRGAASEAIAQLASLSGGLEERTWNLLPAKARKSAQRVVTAQQGVTMVAACACEEDAMPKAVIVSEDPRAEKFVCMSELTPQVWASLDAPDGSARGRGNAAGAAGGDRTPKSAHAAVACAAAGASAPARGKAADPGVAKPDDAAAEVLRQHFASKEWKQRAEAIAALAGEFATYGAGVQLVEESVAAAGAGAEDAPSGEASASGSSGPLLSQYVLRGHRLSSLQASLVVLMADPVTAVFVAACGLLRLACCHVPLYIAPLFLEPLLPPLVTRLLDTSRKVHAKAVETVMEVAALHNCALSEMIIQCVASSSAWSNAAAQSAAAGAMTPSGSGARDCDRSIGPRLQLILQLMQQAQQRGCTGSWTPDTWNALAAYAMKAAEHRNGEVRKDALGVLAFLREQGDTAAMISERATAQLELAAQQRTGKRPGTQSTRLTTGSRLGTSSRLGTGATLNQSQRLGTSSRLSSRLGTGSRLGTSSRLGTGMSRGGAFNASGKLSNAGSTARLSTGRSGTASRLGTSKGGRGTTAAGRQREEDPGEESDNSICSVPEGNGEALAPTMEAVDGSDDKEGAADGVAFFDVQTACPGADEVPDLAEGEAALREALPLAEALDDIALDFVAPLVALFGDGWTRCFYSHHWECRVAALLHLSASMGPRLTEAAARQAPPTEIGELLDGTMRTVHEGLGDQNMQVYAEACRAVSCTVPVFCSAVDGRLLVAHLAPLLRQLCARMGDSKEPVRIVTTQTLFRLLRPPVGDIVTPVAIATLILRHLMPQKAEGDGSSAPAGKGAGNKGAAAGWLCRIQALRDLVKEHPKKIVVQPGSGPGEWIRLQDGLVHNDGTVRYEAARLYALACKAYLRSLGDVEAQAPMRESWVAALSSDLPAKTRDQVRRLLKLSEQAANKEPGSSTKKAEAEGVPTAPPPPWDVPPELVAWTGSAPEAFACLRAPDTGDEKAIISALRSLGRACCRSPEETARKTDTKVEEAFPGVCRATQQVLLSPASANRHVFMCTLELLQCAVEKLAPRLSGLDLNMGLAKTFPTLLDRSSVADVKIAVASDKLVQQLAKHPKVGCEAVTKMVISAIARATKLRRPTMLLHTLLSDFGLRLCAQQDVVRLLLSAVSEQLERLDSGSQQADVESNARPQLVAVLGTCNQFSEETVRRCMGEFPASQRKILHDALKEAPNPKLMALGASAAEQQELEAGRVVVGSAARAASRGRESEGSNASSNARENSPARGGYSKQAAGPRQVPPGLPRGPDAGGSRPSKSPAESPDGRGDYQSSPAPRKGHRDRGGAGDPSPGRRRRRGEQPEGSPVLGGNGNAAGGGSAMANGASPPLPRGDALGASASRLAALGGSPSLRKLAPLGGPGVGAASPDLRRWPSTGSLSNDAPQRWGKEGGSPRRPPAPVDMSSVLSASRNEGSYAPSWGARQPQNNAGGEDSEWERQRREHLSGTADARLLKGKEMENPLRDVLKQVDNGWKTQ
eukprot:TRINITY_DN1572_c0_g4_i2.p1 TRINITY_DN1572_c0_g4~~TRINITY_DN1572_c0_g4_i2.p1  ORF type:complete len:2374 (-),score=582.19 TRINITY_DN1572_c0_g4_i2:113-6397(-)